MYVKMLNKYYQKHKEKPWKEGHERYQNLFEEQKDKRREKVRDRCKNLPEENKNKNYVSIWKNTI